MDCDRVGHSRSAASSERHGEQLSGLEVEQGVMPALQSDLKRDAGCAQGARQRLQPGNSIMEIVYEHPDHVHTCEDAMRNGQ